MNFGAVLLAGGKSTRMGHDKALLQVAGMFLWQHQLYKLREAGAAEITISSNTPEHFTESGCAVVPDSAPDCGPLAGIAAGLSATNSPWVLVLAVDMPAMTSNYLACLVREAAEKQTAVIPRHPNGDWEPLAAVYPKNAAAIALEMIASGKRKMQLLPELLATRQWLMERAISPEETPLFENWNQPEDIPSGHSPA